MLIDLIRQSLVPMFSAASLQRRRPGGSFARHATLAGLLVASLAAAPARAEFRVEITGAGVTQYPITSSPFRGEAEAPQKPASIIQADLLRTGLFRAIPVDAGQLDENSKPVVSTFRAAGSDYLVAGSVQRQGDGRYAVRFRLWDVARNSDMGGQSYTVPQADLRLASHRAADWIYERITGEKGVFSSRVSYVTKAGGRYTLWVADADGENAQAALSSRQSIISPSWSPDGSKLAYVSFESGKPVVYVHDVRSGQRRAVANFRGSNSAPAWSPDGRTLAVTLTKDGGSQLYLIPATGGEPRLLSRSVGIDTEATFSPDGGSVYFVSDRGGSPQIYRIATSGGEARRITFQGGYNISPSISADGRSMAYITRSGGYKVAVMDLQSGTVNLVTDTAHDEKPSFAPNSKMIVYATRTAGGEALMTTSIDGKIKTRLAGRSGDIREPAWAPMGR